MRGLIVTDRNMHLTHRAEDQYLQKRQKKKRHKGERMEGERKEDDRFNRNLRIQW